MNQISQSAKVLSLVTAFLFGCLFMSSAQNQPRYNRFQYHKFRWKAYHSSKFHLYFPADAADSLYRYVVAAMPDAIERVKKATIKEIPKNLNIIIYPSIDQMYETNIGGYESSQFTLPTFVFKGARVVVAYNGSYVDLRQQLYEGLARAIWESEMKDAGGENTKTTGKPGKKTKTAKGSNIPLWFKEGAIRYFAYGWTIAAEDNFRNSLEQNHFTSWQQILSYEPRLGGHAFCYFLAQNYYSTAVAQTVFQLKKKKSLTRAIRLITKTNLDSLYTQCFAYYDKRFVKKYAVSSARQDSIMIPRKKGVITNVLINADRTLVAYISLAKGKRTVYLYDVREGTTKRLAVYSLPPWIGDHSADQYPLIAWHTDGRQLYIAKPKKCRLEIKRYTPDGKWQERTDLDGVDGITSIQPLSDRDFLLTAYRKGQSDIVSYNDNTGKYTAYTDDEYDDSKSVPTGNGNEILFISDRPKEYHERKTFLIGVGYQKDTLWQGLYTIKDKKLTAVAVDTVSNIKWDKPVLLKNGKVLVTTTKYGRERNVLLNYRTGKPENLSDYMPFQYLPESDQIAFFRAGSDSICIIQKPMDEWLKENQADPTDTTSPWLADYIARKAKQVREGSLLKRGRDTTHYLMDEVFAQKSDNKKGKEKKTKKSKAASQSESGVTPYVLQLHSAYFTAQVNNDYFINRYQPFANYLGQYNFPEISGMTKGGFTDLLENHHFTIAYALPAATQGSTFFARYENTEKKIDWGLIYFRKVETLKPNTNSNWVDENGNKYPQNAKDKTHYYELFLKNPLTHNCSLGLQIAARQDRTIFLATDKYSLDFPSIPAAWSINTLSFNLNKLHPTLPYLCRGFKINAYIDMFKGFSRDESFVINNTINLRYDEPIYKYITLVTQLHTGYSGGDEYILNTLGGVDNNVTPRVDTSVHFSQSAPYAFMSLVTPFRGRYQNSLYGNQYVLCNGDLYFPVFQTLIPLETPLPFINNLQLGLLSDVANVKETWNDRNANNDKLLWSYGLSARSMLAGYPLRLEVAWPGTFSKQPVWYFSLNLQ